MLAEFDIRYVPESREIPQGRVRTTASWRGVIAAWVLVALVVLVFAGLEAAALFLPQPPRSVSELSGVVIPQHDPGCAAPQVYSNPIPSHCQPQTDPADSMYPQERLLTPGS
jgi:hypothetical protein